MKSHLFISILLAVLLFQSCSTTKPATYTEPAIGSAEFDYWIHSPLHPDGFHPVTFKTEIADKQGIKKVELYIYEYELYMNSEEQPSKRRKVESQWGLVHTWEYEHPTNQGAFSFTFDRGFHDFSNVEYVFKVYDSNGHITQRMAQFDAGQSPWPKEKILLYSTSKKPLKETINLCFLADKDYQQDWNDFLGGVEDLIYEGYHTNNKISKHKDLWQFYYTQHEMDGQAIAEDYYDTDLYPLFLKHTLIQGIDAFGLLHKTPYGDGAYLHRNLRFLAYNLFTSEAYNHGTAIHETAHAIFNLSDEYDRCVCFEGKAGANVFASLKACQRFNKDNGFPVEDCSIIQHLNGKDWYMSEKDVYFKTRDACEAYNTKHGFDTNRCERFIDWEDKDWFRSLDGLCIMQDDGDHEVRDFKRTCSHIIDKYYARMEKSPTPTFRIQEQVQTNIFGYEPVIMMELQTVQSDIAIKTKEVVQGVPKKNLMEGKEFQLEFYNATGTRQHTLPLANPGELFIHGEHGAGEDQLIKLQNATYRFAIPLEADIKTVTYKFKKKISTPIPIK